MDAQAHFQTLAPYSAWSTRKLFESATSCWTALIACRSEPRVASTLAHVFNHGTHHRRQITAAITTMGQACPELDLVWMLQAESARP